MIDGFIRDSEAIMQMDYTVFCRGFMPCKPSKSDEGEIDAAVSCGGVEVAPGDVLVGDCDGIVAIPRAKLKEVLMASERKHLADSERKRTTQQVTSFADSPYRFPGLDGTANNLYQGMGVGNFYERKHVIPTPISCLKLGQQMLPFISNLAICHEN